MLTKRTIILSLKIYRLLFIAAVLLSTGAALFAQSEDKHYAEFSHEGFYVKDYFVYLNPEDKIYHLYYNIGKAAEQQRWKDPYNEEQFGHATSKDLKTWKIHDTILPVVHDTWESDVVSAPFVVQHEGNYYMAYTGFGPNANQRMGMATSDDLFIWNRIHENPVAAGPDWTLWKDSGWADYRDPALLKWNDTWIAFNTVKVKGDGLRGGLALSVSKDLIHWEHLPREKAILTTWHIPESPLAFERNGMVYLIASEPLKGGRQMWMTDDPLSGQWVPIEFSFPEGKGWSGWEYTVSPEGKDILSAFYWQMNGNFIRFFKVEWDGVIPRLVK